VPQTVLLRAAMVVWHRRPARQKSRKRTFESSIALPSRAHHRGGSPQLKPKKTTCPKQKLGVPLCAGVDRTHQAEPAQEIVPKPLCPAPAAVVVTRWRSTASRLTAWPTQTTSAPCNTAAGPARRRRALPTPAETGPTCTSSSTRLRRRRLCQSQAGEDDRRGRRRPGP